MSDSQKWSGCPCGRKPELESLEPRLLLDADGANAAGLADVDPAALAMGPSFSGDPSAQTPAASAGVTAGAASDMATAYNFNVDLPSRVDKNNNTFVENRNSPIGTSWGIHPGRVVWVHDPAATKNSAWVSNTNASGPFFWDNAYTDQLVIQQMMVKGLLNLTGEATPLAAWTALINNFNTVHGAPRSDGYHAGETIAIKCNLNNQGSTTQTDNMKKVTPQVINALLDQLVNVVGIPQDHIYVYDCLDVWSTPYWDYFTSSNTADSRLYSPHTRFPQVHFMDHINGSGRNQTLMTTTAGVTYPWGATNFTGDPQATSFVPTFLANANYLISLPVLSAHAHAGVTLCSKNFIGSIGETPNDTGSTAQNATVHNHVYLDVGDGTLTGTDYGSGTNVTYYTHRMGGQPRSFAQFLANQNIGQKMLLNVIDGIWGGWDYGGNASVPTKWALPPFGDGQVGGVGGYPSSLFFSQDTVAIDSVGLDFLWTESTTGQHNLGNLMTSANYKYADDFLHEASQITAPPSGTSYVLANVPWLVTRGSVGTHEHWNSGYYKQYSRNLGRNVGIELVSVEAAAPHVSGIQFNGAQSVSTLDAGPNGVTQITVNFDQAVTIDTTHDVLVQKVTFNGNTEQILTSLTPSSIVVTGSPTTLTINLPNAAVRDAWVKVSLLGQETLNGSTIVSPGIVNAGSTLLDGYPKSTGSGRGYIYSPADMTTGLGIAGQNAVFYVGNLRADANGDGMVDGLDYGAWQNGYGHIGAGAIGGDFNLDGTVDGLDYGAWQNMYAHHLATLPTALGGSADTPQAAAPSDTSAGATDATATPMAPASTGSGPRLIAVTPASGVVASGVTTVALVFDSDVQVVAGAVEVTGLATGAHADYVAAYDAVARTLTLTWAQALPADAYTVRVVADFVTGARGGAPLDGEVGNPAAATLPSGDGTPGGDVRLEFTAR